MKTIMCVIGTRPEAIKMAPVVLAARRHGGFRVVLCASGQHRELLRDGLETFSLQPDLDLQVMQGGQGLDALTACLLTRLSACLEETRPDAVLVHGDTQTCLCAAQAAFWQRIPVGHIEAGLRSHVRDNPFPEEMNRRLTDALCDWHFAPTARSRQNLLCEGVSPDSIVVTGNTAIDALYIAAEVLEKQAPSYVDFDPSVMEGRQLVLVTGHRRENHGKHLAALCKALIDVVREQRSACVVYSVHPNPQVREVTHDLLSRKERVYLIPPQPYLSFIALMLRSRVIVTDSGGIQEEAPSLGKTVLVTRRNTERPEVLSTGLVRLVGNSRALIRSETLRALENRVRQGPVRNPCGDGRASVRIMKFLEARLMSRARSLARWRFDGSSCKIGNRHPGSLRARVPDQSSERTGAISSTEPPGTEQNADRVEDAK
jgi:UDP-N-acetylglucosamine 2-epimerase (hydrolysing)